MDDLLKLAAEASLHTTEAEEALEAGEHLRAREALDAADDALGVLRSRWPSMSPAERPVVGAAAGPIRRRLDAVRARLPKAAALTVGLPEADPEQDEEPEV